uniref:Acyl coenzyme a thioesterase 9 mitochondrial n=1 Tax=Rhipicephalus zambeziensis TaxID=60191 RepID=A0A224YIT7_9ACAR
MALSRTLATLLRQANCQRMTGTSVCLVRSIITFKEPIRPKMMPEVMEALKSYVGYVGDINIDANLTRPAAHTKLPSSQDELPVRSMVDSYDECIIPLASSLAMQKSHTSGQGFVRFGRILEDMDEFAVWLSYRYVQYPGLSFGVPMPVNMVTALVDSIRSDDMDIRPQHDLKLCGHISWVGRTSMEVTMELQALVPEQPRYLLTAKFVMVAMEANATKTVPVNKLVPKNEEEQAIFDEGAASVARRKKFQASGILKQPPTQEERDLLHKLFLEDFDPETYILKSGECPVGAIWMQDARLTNVIICQPEFENLYNKVFGGFLMRNAFELAWSTTYILSGRRPRTYYTDDIWFRKPVELGSLLHYESQVVYTQDNFVQVNVNATVIKPGGGKKEITNVFHFTFSLDGDNPAPRVIPRSYPESMLYIEGKRYLDHALSKRKPAASHSHSHGKIHSASHGSAHESKTSSHHEPKTKGA